MFGDEVTASYGMLVHRRVTPSIKFAGTHLYTWVERGTVRVKYLAQKHNAMSTEAIVLSILEIFSLAKGGTVIFETRSSIERVSNSTVPPLASENISRILNRRARSRSLNSKCVVKPSGTRFMAERKGQVYADK